MSVRTNPNSQVSRPKTAPSKKNKKVQQQSISQLFNPPYKPPWEKTLLELEEEKIMQNQKKPKFSSEGEKRPICRFYLRGHCKFGERCRDSHFGRAQHFRELRRKQLAQKASNFYKENLPLDYADFNIRMLNMYKDFKRIAPLFRRDLDVLFVLDVTYSMTDQLEACKSEIRNIISKLQQQFRGLAVRLGIVAFRDHQYGAEDNIHVFKFSSDVGKCVQFLSNLKCKAAAGNDYPEDIVGGMLAGLKLEWKAASRYAILITDAPCHGQQYHHFNDSFPTGDPCGYTVEELTEEYANLRVDLAAITLHSSTDQMYRQMNYRYRQLTQKEIQMKDLGGNFSFQAFTNFLTESISKSVQSSTQVSSSSLQNKLLSLSSEGKYDDVEKAIRMLKGSKNSTSTFGAIREEDELLEEEKVYTEEQVLRKLNKQEADDEEAKEEVVKEGKLKIDTLPLEVTKENMSEYSVRYHTFYIVSHDNGFIDWQCPLIQTAEMLSKVRIAHQPFSCGAMRYAFFMHDIIDQQDQVCKLPMRKMEGVQQLKEDIEVQVICQYIVNQFNDRILAFQDVKEVTEFTSAFVVEVLEDSDKKKNEEKIDIKWAYGENFLSGKYQKYNNNAGWTDKESKGMHGKIAATLSHFSWQLTQGYMLMSDLQGVGNLLTDPQLHCLDRSKFGQGNLGLYGMLLFFQSHECTDYCKSLGLLHPRFTSGMEPSAPLFPEVKLATNQSQMVRKVCELCRKVYELSYHEFMDKRLNRREFWCVDCTDKRNNSMKVGQCELCSQSYNCSAYYYRMKKSGIPVLCYECRKKDREKMRQEIKTTGQYQEYGKK